MSAITIAISHNQKHTLAKQSLFSFVLGKPLLWLVGIVILTLLGLQLGISNYLATKGGQLATVNQEINKVQNDNLQLKAQIAKYASLINIETQAQNLGMKKATQYLYINQTIPLALK